MIVIDASILVNALSDDSRAGDLARARLRAEHRLVAPQLIDLEVVSVLRTLVRREIISVDRASTAVVELARFPIARYDHVGIVERTWELRDTLSSYDASYLALAESLRCRLVTNDVKLAKGAEHAKSPARVEVLTAGAA
jgi:predicted nucleic acid-binding protein